VFSLIGDTMASPPPSPDRPVVILAVTRSTGSSRDEMLTTIRALRQEGIHIRLLTTCVSEDGESLSRLATELGVDFIAPATWQGVVDEFKSSSLVVTNRLHCVIFAFFANVPVVPLRNREKVAGLSRDAGFSRSIGSISELTPEKALECIGNAATIHGEMRRYLAKVRTLLTAPWNHGN
jgi:polysaccharide pyruvyl transferase WcaK-like protein